MAVRTKLCYNFDIGASRAGGVNLSLYRQEVNYGNSEAAPHGPPP